MKIQLPVRSYGRSLESCWAIIPARIHLSNASQQANKNLKCLFCWIVFSSWSEDYLVLAASYYIWLTSLAGNPSTLLDHPLNIRKHQTTSKAPSNNNTKETCASHLLLLFFWGWKTGPAVLRIFSVPRPCRSIDPSLNTVVSLSAVMGAGWPPCVVWNVRTDMGWSSKILAIHGILNVQQRAFHILSCFNQSPFILWPAGMMRVMVKVVYVKASFVSSMLYKCFQPRSFLLCRQAW